jgi:hypothetical protein
VAPGLPPHLASRRKKPPAERRFRSQPTEVQPLWRKHTLLWYIVRWQGKPSSPCIGRIAMNAHNSAPFHALRHLAISALILGFATAPMMGCGSGSQSKQSLRAELATLRTAHGDPDSIGTLDATAPPPDLNEYRKPVYRAVSDR